MSKTDTATKSTKAVTANHRPSAEEIATRAHQIFLERGGEPGHDVEDWLQAERELSRNGSN
jgi:hypothetical protein